jgi:4-amino-4-deoxy-L-arabinose transferase-like glycosyltransferase
MRSLPGFLLFVFSFLILIPGTVTLPLMDRDEPRFAQATLEMMETEQWVIPYFDGEYRFDKPPLTYWWMRIHYLILGKGELAARLHSIFAAGLTALVIARLGGFLYTRRAGILAGFGFLTITQTLVHGRLCVADMPMILGLTATMDAFVRYLFRESEWSRGEAWGHLLYLASALAVGFLAKGPIAWIVPCLAIALYVWPFGRGASKERLQHLRRIPWMASFGLATGVCLIWAIPALVQTEGKFFEVGIGTHVVERGLRPFNDRIEFPGVYYLATIIPSLLPWSAFSWKALFRGGWPKSDPKRSLLLSWYLTPFLIFSFYSTQLPHYVMPGFAAFLLLLFRDGELPVPESSRERVWLYATTGGTLLFTIGGLIFLGLVQANFKGEMRAVVPIIATGLVAVAFVGGIAPFLVLLSSRFGRSKGNPSLKISLTSFAVLFLLGTSGITCFMADKLRSANLSTRIESYFAEGGFPDRIVSHGYGEPSLVFYLSDKADFEFGTHPSEVNTSDFDTAVETTLLVRTRTWSPLEGFFETDIQPKFDVLETVTGKFDRSKYKLEFLEGYNPARTTWEEVAVISRR